MAKLTVEIVTPEKRILTAEADEVVIPGAQGLFGVRPGHTAYLSLLSPGALTLVGEQTRTFFVTGGFAEVSADRVMVLANGAEAIADVDVEAAKKRLAEAQERLVGMSADHADHAAETLAVEHERARITAVSAARH